MSEQAENIISNDLKKIWDILAEINDPEVPVLSVLDLGIIRDVECIPDTEEIRISITPTYMNIRMALLEHGYSHVSIQTVLSPAWTTDWMSEHGKEKLKAFGIAPPTAKQQVCDIRLFHQGEAIPCPQCNSYHTELISQFGSTACKALYRCLDCQEPFDYFKCH